MENFEIRYKKLYKPFSNDLEHPRIFRFLKKILADDTSFLYVVAAYSVIISLLSVTVPISVQLLINSVSYTALLQPIITLGIILLILLSFSGVLYALQFYTAEIFQRRFMANMAAKICKQFIGCDVKALESANGAELVNRFFDVITVQKTVPKFLTKTLFFIFQTIIGLVVVSFYHPFFLAFSILIALLLYLIYIVYFRKAALAAFYESRRKYDIVGWFEDIANNIEIFKSDLGQKYAKYKVNELTRRYLSDRKVHFSKLFSQVILLFLLYAFSSTLLLILGGYLVLKGELTIGQLVAAELILSAVLYGLSQFGKDFENMYDLIAACEKLSIFFNIPQQKTRLNKPKINDFKLISFENASAAENPDRKINLTLEKNKKYLIHSNEHHMQRFIVEALQDFNRPYLGEIKIDDKDYYGIDTINFRDKISYICDKPLMEGSLVENLTFNLQTIERGRINKVLKDLGLDSVVNKFEEKLDLRIIPSGWPLNRKEVVLLKIARSLLLNAKIIIINEIIDIIDYDLRQYILKYVANNSDATLIYFSNHEDDETDLFDNIIWL